MEGLITGETVKIFAGTHTGRALSAADCALLEQVNVKKRATEAQKLFQFLFMNVFFDNLAP